MYELVIKTKFSSAHRLKHYKGKCEELHGHNWDVQVILEGEAPDKIGLLIDFKEAKKIIHKETEMLDHKYLNQIEYFKTHNPTTENLARFLYGKLSAAFKRRGVKVKKVGVWESPECGAYFSEE
ncbi:MAG: 6-carboxytetrahydropterin synthase QueD [Planctomycetes bacterium]|nr:6-carboxytetrahydropterin synthase QueD [Planctomycetota bacterium]